MCADAAANFIGLGDVVGADRDQPAIADLKLTMKAEPALRAAGDPWGRNPRG